MVGDEISQKPMYSLLSGCPVCMPLHQANHEIGNSSGVGSLLLKLSNLQSSPRLDPPGTVYLVSRHMNVDVVGDQVLLRSHVL